MFKKLVPMLVVAFIATCSIAASAAPSTVGAYESGNASGLIDIKNPSASSSTTTQDSYIISGVGLEGVDVGVYNRQYEGQDYTIIVVDGQLAEQIIGPSGLFAQKVYLIQGKNDLLVRAEAADGSVQIEKFEINLLNDSFWERIKKVPFNLQQEFSALFN